MGDYIGQPEGLSETETLARLTVDEKRKIAVKSILDFPHLNHSTLNEWLVGHGADVDGEASLQEKTEVLLDQLIESVDTGEDPKALDRFIYGYLYPANLRSLGIDPNEVANRDRLDTWDGVYEEV